MTKVCTAVALATAMLATSTMAEKKADDELILGLFTPKCFEAFATHHDFANVDCIKAVVSKALSYAIITGSLILKLPQILKILGAKDVTGLTPSAFYMEVVLYLSSTIYNVLRGYPLSTWAENLVILAQNIILVLLLWAFYTPKIPVSSRFGLVVVFAALAVGMFSIPDEYQWLLASAGIPVSIVARIPQILSNFKQGHTGQLALVTLVLNFAGSIARAFTTMQETGDPVQVAGFGVATLLNGTLVLQVLLFWGATNKALAQASKKKDQ
ncbi:Mannose-P-dolichol utilization defect 1 protein [Phytophthora megakarya]|uniref:Mannose-P-dolichol utilization defect 1 protein homolog n=1 Tax=Phytophthora megakarya TaxID=4795 RepID=A0A225VUR1_9STRA|nr:Mannose-P-dolichol utilization defect 1 protein [Phytophthora megakarya]